MKPSMTIGRDAKGELHPLYLGHDAGEAKAAYSAAINGQVPGIVFAWLFIRPQHDRRAEASDASEAPTLKPFTDAFLEESMLDGLTVPKDINIGKPSSEEQDLLLGLATPPEVKAEPKPEVKAEPKPEVKAEPKPEVKATAKAAKKAAEKAAKEAAK